MKVFPVYVVGPVVHRTNLGFNFQIVALSILYAMSVIGKGKVVPVLN
jgi:hypothetical protein